MNRIKKVGNDKRKLIDRGEDHLPLVLSTSINKRKETTLEVAN